MRKSGRKYIEVKTRYGKHISVLEPDEAGYTVTVPGLTGVVTWGKNVEQAKKMAKEAIELCVECLAEERIAETIRRRIKTPARVGGA